MAVMNASARPRSCWQELLLNWLLFTAVVSAGSVADAVVLGSPHMLPSGLLDALAAGLVMAIPFTGIRRRKRNLRSGLDVR